MRVNQNLEALNRPRKRVTDDMLTGIDKQQILEHFVENDDALSLLLDFISSRHLQEEEEQEDPLSQAVSGLQESFHEGMSSPAIGLSGFLNGFTMENPSLASQLKYQHKNSGNFAGSGADGS
jgi:hypothetical protein